MKRFLVLLLSFLPFLALNAQEEERRFYGGFRLGMNTSQIDGDGYMGFNKFSPVIGAFVQRILNDKWSVQGGLLYQGKGSHKPVNHDSGQADSYKIELQYMEIPLVLQVKWRKFVVEGGVGIAYLFHHKESNQNGTLDQSTFNFRKYEIDGIIGLNYQLNEHFILNFRTHRSLTSIVEENLVTPYGRFGGAYNTVLSFSLSYRL